MGTRSKKRSTGRSIVFPSDQGIGLGIPCNHAVIDTIEDAERVIGSKYDHPPGNASTNAARESVNFSSVAINYFDDFLADEAVFLVESAFADADDLVEDDRVDVDLRVVFGNPFSR